MGELAFSPLGDMKPALNPASPDLHNQSPEKRL